MKRAFSAGSVLIFISMYIYFMNRLSFAAAAHQSSILRVGYVATISSVLIFLLLIIEGRLIIELKRLYIPIPFMFLFPFIIFAWEPRLLIKYFPIVELIFNLDILFNWFFLGTVIGIYIVLSMNYFENMRIKELIWPSFVIVIATSVLGIMIFAYPYGLLFYDKPPVFPFNYLIPWIAEGSIGAILIISIYLAIYLSSRFIVPKFEIFKENAVVTNQDSPGEIKWKKNTIIIIEVITALSAISAAFSIMGFIINDGSLYYDVPEVSFEFILLVFLGPLPLILLVSRKFIFRSSSTIIKP